jgi:hypothetical protein
MVEHRGTSHSRLSEQGSVIEAGTVVPKVDVPKVDRRTRAQRCQANLLRRATGSPSSAGRISGSRRRSRS